MFNLSEKDINEIKYWEKADADYAIGNDEELGLEPAWDNERGFNAVFNWIFSDTEAVSDDCNEDNQEFMQRVSDMHSYWQELRTARMTVAA